MRTLIIDNYDSFTYNLFHYMAEVSGTESVVLHDQVDILAGLPSPFSAVRYHSLVATGIPGELEVIGWTPEGIVMAVRHRRRPLWGVQFHPESMCTEHGHQLLGNFAELTRRWHRDATRTSRPVPAAGSAAGTAAVAPALVRTASMASAARTLRVLPRRLAVEVAAEVVFDALYRESECSFWLDSSLPRSPDGRFSVLGDSSGSLSRIVTADVWAQQVTVESATGVEFVEGGFFDWIRADLDAHPIEPLDLPFDFALGWVGYLGYELKAECGGERVHRSDYPEAMMLFADRAIVFDHEERLIYLLALAEGRDDGRAQRWLAETVTAVEVLATRQAGPDLHPDPEIELGRLRARHDRARYLRLIAACQREITAGESYEVDCVRAAFPGGSMTGAPKIRTMRLIDDLEGGPRGMYSGVLGYFSPSGAADFSMVIRTLLVAPGRIEYGVGGAIIALSDPDAEFEETALKATPLLQEFPERSIQLAPGGRR